MKSRPASATRSSSAMIWLCVTGAPLVGARKRQRQWSVQKVSGDAVRPDLDAAVADHRQLQAVAARACCSAAPSSSGVAARASPGTRRRRPASFVARRARRSPASAPSCATLAAYATALSVCGFWPRRAIDGLGELLGADLLLADALVVDVVGVDAVLDRAQPGVVDALGDVGLADVHQHHAPRRAAGPTGSPGSGRRGAAPSRGSPRTSRTARRCWPSPPGRPSRRSAPRRRRGCRRRDSASRSRRTLSGVSAILAAPMSTIQCSFSMSGYSARDLVEDLVEQAVGHLHDVVFGEARDLLAVVARARTRTRSARSSRSRAAMISLRHCVTSCGLAVLDAGVEVFLVLADDHDVHLGMLGVDERVVGDARAARWRTGRASCAW